MFRPQPCYYKSLLFLLLTIHLSCGWSTGPVNAQAQDNGERIRLRMDGGWRFHIASTGILDYRTAVNGWTWSEATPHEIASETLQSANAHNWRPAASGEDVFQGRPGYAWYRATLPPLASAGRVVHFDGVDDNAVVFLNGKTMARHQGYSDPFDVPLDSAWRSTGPNQLLVLVQNVDGPGGISPGVTLGAVRRMSLGGDPARPDYDDSRWRAVHLPQDYVIEGAVAEAANNAHANLPPRTAWYRKTFSLPKSDEGKSVWIDFDGVYRDAKVTLNGHFLGEHPSGYTSFRYDISNIAHYGGRNVLAVFVDPSHFEGWWYEGGGIYRHVWLNVAGKLHVAPWGTFVTSRVKDPLSHPSARLDIKTMLTNRNTAPRFGLLVSRVYGPDGRLVAQSRSPFTIGSGGSRDMTQTVAVAKARLWSLEAPRLYRLRTVVMTGSRITDAIDTLFGIRTIRFDTQKGFFLNERPVKIKGTCNHQDFAGVGIGVPDTLETWRVRKLKEMGSNAWRMSHNPPTPELLDACDRLGMLVMDENRHLGDTQSAKTSPSTGYSDLSELPSTILRDRNHPSIILWSLCNEEPLQGTDEGGRIFGAMKQAVLRLDTTRPITSAMNGGFGGGISNVEDLQGFNYNVGEYDKFHRAHPDQPCFGSETASTVSTRGIYENDRKRGYATAYDLNAGTSINTAEAAWQPIADRDYMAGAFIWTGFDYEGEPAPYGWPAVSSNFGVMDLCGFPKDNYYYYQAVWGDRPVVHLLPHWNWPGKEGQPIDVWAYSNARRVELFLNGQSLGVKAMPRNGHLSWSVPYAPGVLLAKGYGTDGRIVATDRVATTGAPAALRMRSDRATLTADGEDAIPIEVDVVDAQGRIVPTAANGVTFSIHGAGDIAGVGNGNPGDHSPNKAASRHAFGGRCMVIVGSEETPGTIAVTASARGLKSATIRLRSGL